VSIKSIHQIQNTLLLVTLTLNTWQYDKFLLRDVIVHKTFQISELPLPSKAGKHELYNVMWYILSYYIVRLWQ
jgi:hypothetical protein